MKKSELVSAIAEQSGMTKGESARAVNAIMKCIENALIDGDTIDIRGFGTFSVRERAARIGRNPRTGEKLDIEATNTVKFKAGKDLKDAVNN